MRKLAIFDLDGTLLNTIDDLAASCNFALGSEGLPGHEPEAYKQFVGNGVHNLMVRAMPAHSDTASTQRVEAVFRVHYAAHAQERTRPYEGIPDALAGLRRAGLGIAVLSNKPDAYTGALVAEYLPGLVDVAFGQREGVPIKPDPAAVHEILGLMRFGPEEAVYIGDSGVDMETGLGAGLYTVGVSWGFRTKEELRSAGAHVIIDKPAQLVEIMVDNG